MRITQLWNKTYGAFNNNGLEMPRVNSYLLRARLGHLRTWYIVCSFKIMCINCAFGCVSLQYTKKSHMAMSTAMSWGLLPLFPNPYHGYVIKWKHFLRYWPSVRESSGHRWILLTRASDAELWCYLWSASWTNGWGKNRDAGDLRRLCAQYKAIIM